MNQEKRVELKKFCRNIRAALAQADGGRADARRGALALREALRPGARNAGPVLRAAAPRHDPERLRAARQRLAAAQAALPPERQPRLMTNSEMREWRDGLEAGHYERLLRLSALELEMVAPTTGETGRRRLGRSNQDNFDTGMPYGLASHLGRM
jgi:hypothetical protein